VGGVKMNYPVFSNAHLIIGRGSIESIVDINENRFALVGDFKALGEKRLKKIETMLKEAGKEIKVIASVEKEPTTSDFQDALTTINDFQPDCILAIGGGSAMDFAKVLWMFYEHPCFSLEQAFQPFSVPPMGSKAKLIAVPTTSGTGSETTCVAVLVDKDTKKKRLIMSRNLIPSIAIIDSDFPDTMPKHVAAYSGLDALSHALEAAACRISSQIVKTIAISAAQEIIEWLPASVNETDEDKKSTAREIMHNISTVAGMAINNSCTGLSHAMDQIGPLFGLPHGLVCGILLPYTIDMCCPTKEYVSLSRRLGYTGDDGYVCKKLVKRLFELNKELGIPLNLKNVGITLSDMEKNMDELVENAMSSASTALCPAKLSQQQLRGGFLRAYHGEPLDS
jgi:alcohol dehydrogenase class IV